MTVMTFEDAPPIHDTTPPTIDIEYPCDVCGAESGPYGGRGRKPKRCPDHKSARATSGETTSGRRRAGGKLAELATDKLVQLNGFAALACLLVGLPRTAGAFADAEDTFRAYVQTALESDEKLCRTIIRTGQASSGIALIIAYSTLAANVAPVAVSEWRQRRAEAAATLEGETLT